MVTTVVPLSADHCVRASVLGAAGIGPLVPTHILYAARLSLCFTIKETEAQGTKGTQPMGAVPGPPPPNSESCSHTA